MRISVLIGCFAVLFLTSGYAFSGSTASAPVASTQANSSTQPSGVSSFDFKIQKGQYFFLGRTKVDQPGVPENTPNVETIEYLYKGLISSDASSNIWNLQITMQDAPEMEVTRWKLALSLSTNNGPGGSMFLRLWRTWYVDELIGKEQNSQAVPIEEMKASKSEVVQGVEFHKFLYATVGGKPQHLVLVIGDKTLFPKIIHVPDKMLDITWNQFWFPLDQRPSN